MPVQAPVRAPTRLPEVVPDPERRAAPGVFCPSQKERVRRRIEEDV